MKRIPIVATMVVLFAVAAMVALGLWQLDRAQWKEALIARYAANVAKPPVAYPRFGPVPDDVMFRKSSANCLDIAGWRVEAGKTATGITGYRQIAECRTGAEGPGALIDMGVSSSPAAGVNWRGGLVSGAITTEPDHSSLFAKFFGRAPVLRPMLVANAPAPGLMVSAPPGPGTITNNHRAYAVQWFIFAAVALLIYGIALRRRLKS